jgi:metal-dependent amidase/aminoacylase/carboxypeptidase family protein
MIKADITSLTKFRKKLHQHAEIEHQEKESDELI